jgi:hypothetical protein
MIRTPERIHTMEFAPSGRDMFQPNKEGLLELEWIALARLIFEGGLSPEHPDETKRVSYENKLTVALDSLTRFGLAQSARLMINGRPYGVVRGWMPTEAGLDRFSKRFSPQRHGCLCEHSVRLGCVCSEKTYCPNPEHFGNGCHGSHD